MMALRMNPPTRITTSSVEPPGSSPADTAHHYPNTAPVDHRRRILLPSSCYSSNVTLNNPIEVPTVIPSPLCPGPLSTSEPAGDPMLHLELEGVDGLPESLKKDLLLRVIIRAASCGRRRNIEYVLNHYPEYVTLNGRDEDGMTPLMHAAGFGHVNIIKLLLRYGADLELQDKRGWTALMWSVTHGKSKAVRLLTRAGASTSAKTSNGRTVRDFLEHGSLPCAESIQSILNRVEIVGKNRTVSRTNMFGGRVRGDDSDSDSEDSLDSVGCKGSEGSVAVSVMSVATEGMYAPSTYGVDLTELYDIVGTTIIPNSMVNGTTAKDTASASGSQGSDGDSGQVKPQIDDEALAEFDYENCKPHQMFVFSPDDVHQILSVVVDRLSNPKMLKEHVNLERNRPNSRRSFLSAAIGKPNPNSSERSQKYLRRPTSANVIFLASRYAASTGQQELLELLLHEALNRVARVIQNHSRDMMVLAYWIANCSRLLYFMKKDVSLVVTTFPHQVRMSELLQEAFFLLVKDSQRRIADIMDEAIFEHHTMPGFSNVKFQQRSERASASTISRSRTLCDRKRRNRISAYFLSMTGNQSNHSSPDNSPPRVSPSSGMESEPSAFHLAARSGSASTAASGTTLRRAGTTGGFEFRKRRRAKSPRSLTTILSSMLYVMQLFSIHPSLVHQAISQVLYYTSAKLFNGVLSRPELCCRWRAMQIRMNISLIEDWIRSHAIPCPSKDSLSRHLQPFIGLLQFLQIVTHLQTRDAFLETFEGTAQLSQNLNWGHIARAIDQYSYEVGESRVPVEVRKLVAERCKAAEKQYMTSIRDADDDERNGLGEPEEDTLPDDFDAPLRFDDDIPAEPGKLSEAYVSPRTREEGVYDVESWLRGGAAGGAAVVARISPPWPALRTQPVRGKERGPDRGVLPTPPGSLSGPAEEDASSTGVGAERQTAVAPGQATSTAVISHVPQSVNDLSSMNKACGPLVALKAIPCEYESGRALEPKQQQTESWNAEANPTLAEETRDLLSEPYTYHLRDEDYILPFAVPSNVGERLLEVTPGVQKPAPGGTTPTSAPTNFGASVMGPEEVYVEEAPVVPNEVMQMLCKKWSVAEHV